jgi:hypothetical protein
MIKSFVAILSILYLSLSCFSQSVSDIKESGKYIWGQGEGATYDEADKNALDDLISKISVQVESQFENLKEEVDFNLTEYTRKVVKTYSNIELRFAENRILQENKKRTVVLRFIERGNLNKMFFDRRNKIMEYAFSGLEAEDDLRLGDALRQYYWSLVLLRSHPDMNNISIKLDDGDRILLTFLLNRINRLLSDIDIELKEIDYDKRDDRKTIILRISYNGKEVSDLDYYYYTGNNYSALCSAKDGIGIVDLFGEPSREMQTIRLRIEYDYENKSKYDFELAEVMRSTDPPPYFRKAEHLILLPENKKEEKKITKTNQEIAFEAVAASEPPEYKSIPEPDPKPEEQDKPEPDERKPPEPEKPKTDPEIKNTNFYKKTLENIVRSIQSGEHERIVDLFTYEGYQMYESLIRTGDVKVLGIIDTLRLFKIGDEVMVRSVPMIFSYENNNRTFVENVVFTFNKDQKIDALAFAISDIAIYDIVSKPAVWGTLEEKYLIIKFMEYYKTAYCLKRIDYIESIFADNALIIVGHVFQQGEPLDKMYLNIDDTRVKYIKHTKESYMKALRKVFRSNEYVNIHFEDNEVKKVNNIDDKTYGIQIKQHYYSSNYADVGYLFLMIDLNNKDSAKIYVRTWQPEKFEDGSIFGLQDFHF